MTAKSAKPDSKTCTTCGQAPVMRYKNFQFYWVEGADMEISEIPEESILEIHPTFIVFDGKEGWRTVIPMDIIRFINVSNPV